MPVSSYLIVSALLFTIGALGVLVRRNPLIMFMSIELMLNAVNLSFMAFAHFLELRGRLDVRLSGARRGRCRGRRWPSDHRLDLPLAARYRRGRSECVEGLAC